MEEDYSKVEKEIEVQKTKTKFKVSVAFGPMADVFSAVMDSLPAETLQKARHKATQKAADENREETAEDLTEAKREETLKEIEHDKFASKYFREMPGILGYCVLEVKYPKKGSSWIKLGSRVEDRAMKIAKTIHLYDGLGLFQFVQNYLVEFSKGLEDSEKSSDTTEAPVVIVTG